MSTTVALLLVALPVEVSVRGGVGRLTGQQDHERSAVTYGLSALWRADGFIFGGSFDASRRADSLATGKVRHFYVAAVGGASLPVAAGLSVRLVGEAGIHSLSGTRNGPVTVPASRDPNSPVIDAYFGTLPDWAPFAGLRPSIEFAAASWIVGLGGWARYDLRRLMPESYLDPDPFLISTAQAPLSRFAFGADLHAGFRFR